MKNFTTTDKRGKSNLFRNRVEKPDTLARRVRAALGISQREFGERFSPPVHEKTVGAWETGRNVDRRIQLELERMARAANVPIEVPDALITIPKPKHRFKRGDRVQRKTGPKAHIEGEVVSVSKTVNRVRVRWDDGIERSYDENSLRAAK